MLVSDAPKAIVELGPQLISKMPYILASASGAIGGPADQPASAPSRLTGRMELPPPSVLRLFDARHMAAYACREAL